MEIMISNKEAANIFKNAERFIDYDASNNDCSNTLKSKSDNFFKALDIAICMLDQSDKEYCEFIRQKFL